MEVKEVLAELVPTVDKMDNLDLLDHLCIFEFKEY
jgi:hypothetical protein